MIVWFPVHTHVVDVLLPLADVDVPALLGGGGGVTRQVPKPCGQRQASVDVGVVGLVL